MPLPLVTELVARCLAAVCVAVGGGIDTTSSQHEPRPVVLITGVDP